MKKFDIEVVCDCGTVSILNLLLDGSGSMTNELEGKSLFQWCKEAFFDALNSLKDARGGRILSQSLLVNIYVFQREEVIRVTENVRLCDMDMAELETSLSAIRPRGYTPMGAAILQAIGDSARTRAELRSAGADVTYPVMGIFTDGKPTDMDVFAKAVDAVNILYREGHNRRSHLTLIPVGIGGEAYPYLNQLMKNAPEGSAGVIHDGKGFADLAKFIPATVLAAQAGKMPEMPASLRASEREKQADELLRRYHIQPVDGSAFGNPVPMPGK